ncbi:MAG: leucyl aminopeptidase, partial [Rickettsiales bacterium]|nr:leucyl aminopeptidase [Rickettsiales bacterium]
MKITFSASAGTGKAKAKHAIVVTTTDALTLGTEAKAIDKATKGAVAKALKSSRFNGKAGECLSVAGVDGVAGDRVVVLGLGKAKEFDAIAAENAGGQLVAHLNGVAVKSAELILDTVKGAKIDDGEAAARAAFGAYLRAYRFDKYRTKLKDDEKPSLGALKLVSAGTKAAKEAYAELEKVADGVYLARDVVNEPGNVIYPETLADECKKLTDLGVKVEVLNEAKMKKLGMGALLGVGQGSVRESQLV